METLLRSAKKIAVVFLIVSLNASALGTIGASVAMFNDIETSHDNALAAGSVDFSLEDITDWDPSEQALGLFPGDTVSRDIRIKNEGTPGFMYTVKFIETSEDSPLCDGLTLNAELEGASEYEGPLVAFASGGFTHATSTDDWSFEVSLPEIVPYDLQSERCEFSFVFEGGQGGMLFGEGFWDEESLDNTLGSGVWSVTLNEFLPNPDGIEYGFDFGQDADDMPQGEWVELYNNDAKSHDLSGWYIRDSGNTAASKILITEFNTSNATSTILGGDWLVVYINKALLNNTSDTVRLFNEHDRLVDLHSYEGNEFCDLEPTPDEENEDDPSGVCPGVPGNKSYARIPDGTGDWVDPVPTPGLPNVMELAQEEERLPSSEKTATQEDQEMPEFFEETAEPITQASSTQELMPEPLSEEIFDQSATPEVMEDAQPESPTVEPEGTVQESPTQAMPEEPLLLEPDNPEESL